MITRPITIVEIDMPRCTRTYGVAPCIASLSANKSCYNTRATCQDTTNFLSAVQTYRFSDTGIGLPPEVEAIPCIQSVSIAPTKLEPMKGLGQRASISVVLNDFAHHDRGFDPYVSSRTYDPETQGTFFGRFRARHKYYQGRVLRIRQGNIESPWNWTTFSDRTYIIEKITANKDGQLTITAKDILKLTDGDKAQVPIASKLGAKLSADIINTTDNTIVMLPVNIGIDEFALNEQTVGSGSIRIGSEIMDYTRSGDTLTVTRGTWGSTASTHTAGDAIQLCAKWVNVNVATVIKQLLGTLYADVDFTNTGTSYLSDASWINEAVGNSAIYNVTNIISKPEGVDKVISELCEQSMFLIWWDELAKLIKCKGIAPQLTVNELNDDSHLISVQQSDKPEDRVSQIWIYYGKRDFTGDDKPENFKYLYAKGDLDAESVDQYGEQKIKIIKSRWFNSQAPIQKTANRLVIFNRDNPREVKFVVDSKDKANDIAESILMTTNSIQGVDGAASPIGMIITQRAEKGDKVEYTAVSMAFYGRYLRIAPGGSNASGTHVPSTVSGTIAKYGTATAAEKKAYGYIMVGGSNASGTHIPAASSTKFSDGGDPYKFA